MDGVRYLDISHQSMVTNQDLKMIGDIHGEEINKEVKEIAKHENVEIHMAREICYGDAELEIIGRGCIYECFRYPHQDMMPSTLSNHLSHARGDCPSGRAIRTYCARTSRKWGT